MKKLLARIYPYIAIVLFPLFYVNRLFLENYLFYGEERGFLNYDFVNYRYNSIWESTKNFGSITSNHFNVFTTGLFWKITSFFDASWLTSEMLFYYVIIFFTLLFAFLAFKRISKNQPLSLLLSLIYITTFNYYATITTTPKLLQALIIPTSLFFWLLFKETNKIRYFLLNTLVLVLCLGIGINPPQMIGAYSFIFLYILLFDFSSGQRIKATLFYLPYVLNIAAVFLLQLLVLESSGQIHSFNVFDQDFTATESSVYEILRFFGAWWDYEGSQGLDYNHIGYHYHSFIGILATYIPFIVFAVCTFTLKTKRTLINRLVLFAILTMFLVKGTSMPFGELFTRAYDFTDYMKIFREPWAKFITNFIFAIYLGIAFLFESTDKRMRKLFYGLLGFLLIFQLFPLVSGQVIDHRNLSWKVSDVNVPEYWENISQWSKTTTQNKRVLVLPAKIDSVGTLVQDWRPFYYIGYPDEYFLYADIINSQYSNKEDEYITGNFLKHLNPSSLSLGAIEYVIDKKDLMKQENEQLLGIDSIKEGLDTERKISYGALDIYPVKKTYMTPRLHIMSSVASGPNDCSQFFSKFSSEDFKTTAFISGSPPAKESLSTSQPEITRVNSTEYKIDFDQISKGSSALFFAESFNTGWQLYNSQDLFAKPLPLDNQHFIANCLGNLWIIPESQTTKYPTMYVRFTPQLLYEKAKIVYVTLLIVISLAISIVLFRKKSPITPHQNNRTFSIRPPKNPLTGYRLFSLYIPPLIVLFTFFAPRGHSDSATFIVGALWMVSNYLYQIPSRIGALLFFFFLACAIMSRLIGFTIMAESMGIWTFLLFLLSAFHRYVVDDLGEQKSFNLAKALENDLYSLKNSPLSFLSRPVGFINNVFIEITRYLRNMYHVSLWNYSNTGALLLKIILPFVVAIPLLLIFRNIELDYHKHYLTPTIITIEPTVAKRNAVITIAGTMFAHDKKEQAVILSSYGNVVPDSVTQNSITFRVPNSWKSGLVEIAVGRPTKFEKKYTLFVSEKKIIEIE